MNKQISFSGSDNKQRVHAIKRVLWVILLLNVGVALAKYGYGVFSETVSMQADGIHSMFDGASNVIGLIGMALAIRPADYDHPYGHAKFETYASAVIGIFLLVAAYTVATTAISDLINKTGQPEVTAVSFIVMLVTLGVNISVTIWEHIESKRLGSEILGADAKHTLSDVLVSVGVIVGLLFVRAGFTIMDSVMSLVVVAAILFTAFGIFKQAVVTLGDTARIPPEAVIEVVCEVAGARVCHKVRTRGCETEVYVDLHLLVDPEISVATAHAIAMEAEEAIIRAFPQVADVTIHIEPETPEEREKDGGRREG